MHSDSKRVNLIMRGIMTKKEKGLVTQTNWVREMH